MDKPQWGLRVDGPLGRRFLRGLSLTRLWREGCCRAPLNYRRRPLMQKPLQLHLLKRVPPACKGGERTMKWQGRPPIGGQDSDRVSHRCSAPYTLLPLRGISPQGETRDMKRKTGESYTSCTTPAFPLWWLALPPCPVGSMSLDSRVAGLPYESSSFATPASDGTMGAYCRAAYEERPRGVLFCPLHRGKSGAAG